MLALWAPPKEIEETIWGQEVYVEGTGTTYRETKQCPRREDCQYELS